MPITDTARTILCPCEDGNPGTRPAHGMIEEIGELAGEAKSYGHAVVAWPLAARAEPLECRRACPSKCGRWAALLGAHIIKRKPPTDVVELEAAKGSHEKIAISTPAGLIAMSRGAINAGGEVKDLDGVCAEVRAIRDGGRNGSITEGNTLQRPRDEALKMLDSIIPVHSSEARRFAEAKLGVPGKSEPWFEPSAPSRAPRRHGNADMVC